MILEKMVNIRLILGDEKINKMSYSDQLKCLLEGLKYFCKESGMLTDQEIYILSLFSKQIKKKYPHMSEKQLMHMAGQLFSENIVSTKSNENIKKLVIQEYRKFFANVIVKSAQKAESKNDELYIPRNNNGDSFETGRSQPILVIIIFGLLLFLLLGVFLAEI